MANVDCPCGSRRRYRSCCDPRRVYDLLPMPLLPPNASLAVRNLAVVRLLEDLFSLSTIANIDQLKRLITDDRIRKLYSGVAAIFPRETDFDSLVEKANGALRAYYMAPLEPDHVLRNVVRYSLYSDQIFMLNPFLNPISMAPRYNPLFRPDEFKLYTLKTLISMRFLLPWIANGNVQLVPDPGDFNHKFKKAAWAAAEERLGRMSAEELSEMMTDEEEMERMMQAANRCILGLPEEKLAASFKAYFPDKSQSYIDKLVETARKMTEADPLALPGMRSQLLMTVGGNLEHSLFMASCFDAFPYTYKRRQWSELQASNDDLSDVAQTWSPLTKAFQCLDFSFLDTVDVAFANRLKEEGRLSQFRAFLRKTWSAVKTKESWSDESARAYADELTAQHHSTVAEWGKINQDLVKYAGTAVAGFATGTATVCIGKLAIAVPCYGVMAKSVTELGSILMRRKDFPKSFPAAIFMQIEQQQKKK